MWHNNTDKPTERSPYYSIFFSGLGKVAKRVNQRPVVNYSSPIVHFVNETDARACIIGRRRGTDEFIYYNCGYTPDVYVITPRVLNFKV